MTVTSVFVSYARSDSAIVLPFVARLRAAGFDVWLDQTSIAASVPWWEEIVKAARSADLVILMQSPAWRESDNCAREFAVARELGQPILYVDAEDASSDWLDAVKAADAQIGPAQRVRSMLLGASYRWDRARRPSGHLAKGRTLRAFGSVAGTTSDPVAHDFVRSSRRLQRGRTTAKVLAVVVTVGLWLGLGFVQALDEAVAARIQAVVDDAGRQRQVDEALGIGPASGLRVALELAEDEDTWATRSALALALGIRVPDEVEGGPVGHGSDAALLPPGTRVAHGSDVLVVTTDGVRAEGAQVLEVAFPKGTTALAWSPDGSAFAAATPDGVALTRLSSGRRIGLLRGLDGEITRLEWTGEGVIGWAGDAHARWSWAAVRRLGSTGWQTRALSAGRDGRLLLAGARGELALWDGTQLRDVAPAAGEDWPVRITETQTGWLVARNGAQATGELLAVSPEGVVEGTVDLQGCLPLSLVADEATAYVACFDRIIRVDLDRRLVGSLPEVEFQPSAVVLEADGTLLATSLAGELFRLTDSGWEMVGQWAAGCSSGASVVTPSPDGRRLLVTGSSIQGMCTHLRNDPTDRTAQRRLVPPRGVETFRAAAWAPNGERFAAVAASGELWVYDAEQYLTAAVTVPTGEDLVGVQFADASTVFVLGRDGELSTVDISLATADLDTWKETARERSEAAEAVGLR